MKSTDSFWVARVRKGAFQIIAKKHCENLINTGVYDDFWRTFAQNDKKHLKKHYVSQSKLMHFRDIGKSNFSLEETAFCNIGKGHSQNIINTDVYGIF